MTVRIQPYANSDLHAVHALYHDVVVGRVPHCWEVAPDTLSEVLSSPLGQECEDAVLVEQVVLIGHERGDIRGFVHAGVHKSKSASEDCGVIRFLCYSRHSWIVGDALLSAAHQWLEDRDVKRVATTPRQWRYPFYGFANCHLSDHLDHVQSLLRANGYRKTGGEVFLDWPDMEPEAPPTPKIDVELQWGEPCFPGCKPRLRLDAVYGGESIGACVLRSGSDFSDSQEAADFAYGNGLWVIEPFRGRGLGRFLLTRTLIEARARGYRHGAISTGSENERAFELYAHCGFHVVDWTYEFSRDLL